MATQGHASKNQNNHPFPGKVDGMAFALAHNGVLYNDRELQQLHRLPKTNIETDSYVAVQLIEQQKELTFQSLQEMAEILEGSFVFTILDQDNNVYFVKGDNPLTIYHYPELGIYLYASTEMILVSALRALGMEDLEPEVIEPDDGTILMIDRAGRQMWSRFEIEETYAAVWMSPWERAYQRQQQQLMEDFRMEYIRDLKQIAGSYGYAPEDIDSLLLDGFTVDEVEEMICY